LKNGTLRPTVVLQPQSILLAIKLDCQSWSPNSYLDQDFSYLINRYEKEGDAFICVTLPSLGKAVETSLVRSEPLQVPLGWRLHKSNRLPVVLNTYFSYVFDNDGRPRDPDEHSITAVQLLRQVCLFWSKKTTNNLEGEDEAIKKFMDRVRLPRHRIWDSMKYSHPKQRLSLARAKNAIHELFDAKAPECSPFMEFVKNPWGRHGPGAVADHEQASDKWSFKSIPQIPDLLYRWANEDATYPSLDKSPSSRVTCVPKDFRSPRIICIEPKEFQFAQQGLMELLTQHVHEHRLTRRNINFRHVGRSHQLCFNTNFATIDMKDASDLISLQLVKYLFPKWMYRLLVRYRTPNVDETRSTCFATMGSALCFPVQTIVFWALSRGTIDAHKRKQSAYVGKEEIRVFGDDIIVPKWIASRLCDVLTACGMKVNPDKTCISSFVRESCGEWVYAGKTNRILKPKVPHIKSIKEWTAVIDYADGFFEKGYHHLATLLRDLAFEFYRPITRYGRNLQRPEIRVPALVPKRAPKLQDYSALYAWNFHSNTSPFLRETRSRVKWGWIRQNSNFSFEKLV